MEALRQVFQILDGKASSLGRGRGRCLLTFMLVLRRSLPQRQRSRTQVRAGHSDRQGRTVRHMAGSREASMRKAARGRLRGCAGGVLHVVCHNASRRGVFLVALLRSRAASPPKAWHLPNAHRCRRHTALNFPAPHLNGLEVGIAALRLDGPYQRILRSHLRARPHRKFNASTFHLGRPHA